MAKATDYDVDPQPIGAGETDYGIIVYMDDDTEVRVSEEDLIMADWQGPIVTPDGIDWEYDDLEKLNL